MICLFNDELEVIDSPLLIISEAKIKRYLSINNIITNAKFELVEILF